MKKILLIIISLFLITNPLFAGGNRWTSKPPIGSQIDWSHPLSKGLVGCWLMNEGGGKRNNDLSQRNNGDISGATWISTQKEIALNFSSGNLVDIKKALNNFTIFTPFSIQCVFSTTTSAYKALVCNQETGGTGIGIQFGMGNNTEFDDLLFRIQGTTGRGQISSGVSVITGRFYDVVATFKGNSSANGMTLYKDGKLISFTIDTNVLGGSLSSTKNTFIGVRNTTEIPFTGKIIKVLIYSRELSPSEIQQLYQDPYCFIKPPTIWSNFSTAVAAARRFFMFD